MKRLQPGQQGERNEKNNSNIAFQVANMESTSFNEPLGKEESERLHTQCSVRVHSKRKRLTDPDGISCKAVLDGLTKAGILVNDSAKFVKEVSFSQELAKEEETIIIMEWGK